MDKTETTNNADEDLVKAYVNQLSDAEKKALEIAKKQLGSSFSLKKSVGFKKFNSSKTI